MARSRGNDTKRAIVDALFRVVGDKPVDKVSVDDVAREAGISRSTFYRYFSSVNDVIKSFEESLLDSLKSINDLSNYVRVSQADVEASAPVIAAMRVLRDNCDKVLALNGPNGDPSFMRKVDVMLWDSLLKRLKGREGEFSDFDIYLTYAIKGHDAAIDYWLRERPDIPPEEFAKDINRLLNAPFFMS